MLLRYMLSLSIFSCRPMFSMPEHSRHSKRRKHFSNIYAKSTLQGSEGLSETTRILLQGRLATRLQEFAKTRDAAEFYNVFTAITMDFVTAYMFGLKNGSDFIRKSELGREFFVDYKARQRYQFWPQELPILTKFLKSVGLRWIIIPDSLANTNNDIEGWILSMCDQSETDLVSMETSGEKGRLEDYPAVYGQLRNALLKEASTKSDLDTSVEQLVQKQRLDVASEMLDHSLAGFDTSSITLTFLAWELSRPKNTQWQKMLHEELSSLPESEKLDAKSIDALPTLHAIMMETLRLHAAIPGNQPRVTPPSATLGAPGHEISPLPANVRVQAQAWSLHRNPDVFPEPEAWRPDRWLASEYPSQDAFEARLKEMNRWFWAFGSGGRMCVGSNLAIYDMKMIMAVIWSQFRTKVVFDEGMTHRGGYVAEPVGKDGKILLLAVEEIAS